MTMSTSARKSACFSSFTRSLNFCWGLILIYSIILLSFHTQHSTAEGTQHTHTPTKQHAININTLARSSSFSSSSSSSSSPSSSFESFGVGSVSNSGLTFDTSGKIMTSSDELSVQEMSQILLAYTVQTSDESIETKIRDTDTALNDLINGLVDVSFVSHGLGAEQAKLFHDGELALLPLFASAIVPAYRLDALKSNTSSASSSDSLPLSLPGIVIAKIMSGEVKTWSDPLILQANPHMRLKLSQQNTPICVCWQSDFSVSQLVWSTTLNHFYPNLTTRFNISASELPLSPELVAQLYNPCSVEAGQTEFMVTGCVKSNNGAIGFIPYAMTKDFELAYISFANSTAVAEQTDTQGDAFSVSNIAQSFASTSYVSAGSGTMSNAILQAASFYASQHISLTSTINPLHGFDSTTTMPLNGLNVLDPRFIAAWPMTIMHYAIINLKTPRTTCNVRQGLIKFLLWMYESTNAQKLMQEKYKASIPDTVLQQFNVISTLRNKVLCEGVSAYLSGTSSSSRSIEIFTDDKVSFLVQLLASVYQDTHASTATSSSGKVSTVVTLSVETAITSWVNLQKFLHGETDVSILLPDGLNNLEYGDFFQNSFTFKKDKTQFVHYPAFVSRFSPWYNDLGDSTSIYDVVRKLTVDIELLTRVILGNVTRWTDPAWTANGYNTILPSLIQKDPTIANNSLRIVIACQSPNRSTPMYSAAGRIIAKYSAYYQQVKAQVPTLDLETDWCTLYDVQKQLHPDLIIMQADDEKYSHSIADSAPSSIAFAYRQWATDDGFFLVAMRSPNDELRRRDAMLQGTALPSDLPPAKVMIDGSDVALACYSDVKSVNNSGFPFELWLNPHVSSQPCWLFQTPMHIMVPAFFIEAAQGEKCRLGKLILQFLEWVNLDTGLQKISDSSSAAYADLSAVSAIRENIQNMLLNVTCIPFGTMDESSGAQTSLLSQAQGFPLLRTYAIPVGVSSGVSNFAIALSCIGLLCVSVLAVLYYMFRSHPVIKSTSFIFSCLSLFGSGVFFLAPIFLAQNPSTANCGALNWFGNFGFTMLFTPLFMKQLRLYRIFGQKRLKVVKVGDRLLFAYVLAVLFYEMLMLIIWTEVAPLKPVTYLQTNGADQYSYSLCSVNTTPGIVLASLQVVTKGFLLLFGSFLSFSVRKINSRFNESTQSGATIYNCLFTSIIVAPIIVTTNVMGNGLLFLLIFLLLWCNFVAVIVLHVPKMLIILRNTDAQELINAGEISVHENRSSMNSSGRFSFMDYRLLEPTMLVTYYRSVAQHFESVKKYCQEKKVIPPTAGPTVATPAISHMKPTVTNNQKPTYDKEDKMPTTPVLSARGPGRAYQVQSQTYNDNSDPTIHKLPGAVNTQQRRPSFAASKVGPATQNYHQAQNIPSTTIVTQQSQQLQTIQASPNAIGGLDWDVNGVASSPVDVISISPSSRSVNVKQQHARVPALNIVSTTHNTSASPAHARVPSSGQPLIGNAPLNVVAVTGTAAPANIKGTFTTSSRARANQTHSSTGNNVPTFNKMASMESYPEAAGESLEDQAEKLIALSPSQSDHTPVRQGGTQGVHTTLDSIPSGSFDEAPSSHRARGQSALTVITSGNGVVTTHMTQVVSPLSLPHLAADLMINETHNIVTNDINVNQSQNSQNNQCITSGSQISIPSSVASSEIQSNSTDTGLDEAPSSS